MGFSSEPCREQSLLPNSLRLLAEFISLCPKVSWQLTSSKAEGERKQGEEEGDSSKRDVIIFCNHIHVITDPIPSAIFNWVEASFPSHSSPLLFALPPSFPSPLASFPFGGQLSSFLYFLSCSKWLLCTHCLSLTPLHVHVLHLHPDCSPSSS